MTHDDLLLKKVRDVFDWRSNCGRFCHGNDAACSCLDAAHDIIDVVRAHDSPTPSRESSSKGTQNE